MAPPTLSVWRRCRRSLSAPGWRHSCSHQRTPRRRARWNALSTASEATEPHSDRSEEPLLKPSTESSWSRESRGGRGPWAASRISDRPFNRNLSRRPAPKRAWRRGAALQRMKPRLIAAAPGAFRAVAALLLPVLLLLLLLLASSSEAARAFSRRPVAELSNSFIITSFQDLEPQSIGGATQTPCEYAVRRARSIGGRHFSLVVTAYWEGGAAGVTNYAYKDVSGSYPEGFGYVRPSEESIGRWKRGLQSCFRAAINSGFSGLQVLSHIDDTKKATWRNFADFDPTQQYGGFSYEDVVVRPAADALRTVTRPSTKVWFFVAGEMGKSLWRHPRSYAALLSKYRGTLARGKAGAGVQVGLALHWNKVCGGCFWTPHTDTAAEFNATYAKSFKAASDYIQRTYDTEAIRRTLASCDVIGISHYAPMPLGTMNFASFELPFMTAAYELRFWGFDLKGWTQRQGKEFLFSELGLGGAAPDGRSTASDLRSLTEGTENGIWAVYNVVQDPWRNREYREYRRKWFYNLLGFLSYGGSPNVRISAAFVWSVGSFDVAGVHPISSSAEGSYADPEIVGWMKRLSARAATT